MVAAGPDTVRQGQALRPFEAHVLVGDHEPPGTEEAGQQAADESRDAGVAPAVAGADVGVNQWDLARETLGRARQRSMYIA